MGVLKEPENQNRASLKALALQLLCKKIQVGPHGGHSSVEDAVTARELCRLVQVQWEPQAASSLRAPPEDRQPDSSTDMEQYMEDQYWPEDPAQGTGGDTGEAPGRREAVVNPSSPAPVVLLMALYGRRENGSSDCKPGGKSITMQLKLTVAGILSPRFCGMLLLLAPSNGNRNRNMDAGGTGMQK
ncbi:hypothetical protein AB1E18_004955 [Capra hircus]